MSQYTRGECDALQGINHFCWMLKQETSRAIIWPHTAASCVGMGLLGYVIFENQTSILPVFRLLTGDTINRRIVCGSPTPRLSPISCTLGTSG